MLVITTYILRRNCFLKHNIEGKIEGRIGVTGSKEDDVSSYWIILRKRVDTGNEIGST
jgi:hypothetical protein